MKILVLANNQIGLYKFRRELLQEMIAHKYRVYISTPEDVLSEEISSLGCKLIINKYLDRRGTDPIEDFRLLLYYKKLMEKVLPDIVLTYTIKPNVYGGLICRIKRIPYIANVTGLGTSIENGGLLQALTLTLYKVGLKKANAVFFQNHDNLNFMLKHHIVKRENVKLIPGSGVNTKDNGYEEYPPSDEAVIFSTFGRIMKDKGIDELLGAAEKVKRDHKECTFQLVGDFDENYEDMVKNKVTQGIVEYIPFQKDIHNLIAESHAIIHPSYHEGMSNVLQEAASTGRPILASNIPGCREIFDEGVSGIGFEPKKVESLVQAVERFLLLSHTQKAEMGKNGREKMAKEFDRNIVVQKYMEEIKKVELRK